MTEKLDLTAPGVLSQISRQILYDIDKACVAIYAEEPRGHLGASIVGKPCSRQIWFDFRWAKRTVETGRQYRLFNRGHKEEERFVEWLEKAGFEVQDTNPETGKQWRISGVQGHFAGSMDGQGKLPAQYGYDKTILYEFKTNGTGTGFNKLLENGVAKEKPVHFAQMSVYGYKTGIEYGVYLNICKNDDNIHTEIVKLDHSLGADMEKKATIIIHATEAPPRISNQPTYFECKWCKYKAICFEGESPQKNCRTCINSVPIEDAQWYCKKWNATIPEEVVPQGCAEWSKNYEA